MSENKKVLFIINKHSGAGYRKDVEGKILAHCDQQSLECTISFTEKPGHATELARDAQQQDFSMVFAVGGDGTVNETARALVNGQLPLGILPKGSGNGLARHLGIPLSFNQALHALLPAQRIAYMDTFRINGHISVNVSGIGFDGHIASLFGKNGKRGFFNYARLVLGEFKKYQESDFEVSLDGKPADRSAFIVALANSSQFGNNARVAPQASIYDQLLDVCFIHKVPFTQAIPFATRMFSGRLHTSSFVDIHKVKAVTIRAAHPMAYHIDGEPMPASQQFEIEILPGSLPILVPANRKSSNS